MGKIGTVQDAIRAVWLALRRIAPVNVPALERFSIACDMTGPLQLVVEGTGKGSPDTYEIAGPFAVIGRDPAADLVLHDSVISRRHACLQVIAGRVFLVDLGSRTGVRWDDGPRQCGWVDSVQGVQIGPYRVRPRLNDLSAENVHDAPQPTSRSFAQPGLPELTLEFLDSEPALGRSTWRASRSLVLLGRSPACRIQLAGADVSAIHASLVRTPAGTWVVDHLGRAGTSVNGSPARVAILKDRDELRLGGSRIRVHIGPSESGEARGLALAESRLASTNSGRPDDGVGQLIIPEAAYADPTVIAYFHEFRQMQVQMADQFQQALMMMFQTFSGMHQDQMALIREELTRLHQLSEEQQVLQARLADPNWPPSPGRAPTLHVNGVDGTPAGAPKTVGVLPVGPPGEAMVQTTTNGHDPGAEPVIPLRPRSVGGVSDGADLHGKIIQHLAVIQQERQGRWQRLLGSVLGRGTGEPVS
jgi:pSer/pThr/pTyr-binding forkhead associated (FHA) protein